MMHQCLVQWIGGTIEVVSTDSSFSIASADAHVVSYDNVKCFSSQTWEKDFLRVADYESVSIQASKSSDES